MKKYSIVRSLACSIVKRALALAFALGLAGAASADHVHCLCGDGACTAAGHSHADVEWQLWESVDTLPDTAGNWFLTNDVTLAATYAPPTGVNLCLNGHVVKQGATGVRVIEVASGCTVTITDCCGADATTEQKWTQSGSVWTLSPDATGTPGVDYLTTTGGVITGGAIKSDGGAGIRVNGGTLNLYACTVAGNEVTSTVNFKSSGGGLQAYVGTVNVYGGRFCGNSGYRGGGIAIDTMNAAFRMLGGLVDGNYDTCCGAGFYIYGDKKATAYMENPAVISNVVVSGNVDPDIGGAIVYEEAGAWARMVGVTAVGNACTSSDGDLMHVAGRLELLNCRVSDNTGSTAAYLCYDGTMPGELIVGGTTVVSDNLSGSTPVNVYLASGRTVTVSEDVPLAAGASIGVTTKKTPAAGSWVPVTSNRGADHGYFTSDNASYLVVDDEGVVKLAVKDYPAFYVYRDGTFVNGYATLSAACNAVSSGAAGNWTIKANKDYTCTEGCIKITVGASKPITIDTNGKTITATSGQRIFWIYNNTVVTLVGSGTFVGNGTTGTCGYSWASGGFAVVGQSGYAGSRLVLDGPTLKNFRSAHHGGAICLTQGSAFEMESGMITGCTSVSMGGGAIGIEGHSGNTFTMTGGTICGNTSDANGGALAAHGAAAKVYLLGGVISNNVCSTTGAGVDCVATVTVGGTFRCVDNVSASTKGDLYLPAGQTVAVSTNTPFAADAEVRVLTATAPSGATHVAVTSNRGEDLGYFASDAGAEVVAEDGVVKLAQWFTVTFRHKASSTDEQFADGSSFSSPTNVLFVYGSSADQVPAISKPGAVFLGWTTNEASTTAEYTSDQIPTLTTINGDSKTLYSVYGVEVALPVFVALDGLGVVPKDGRTYEVSITNGNATTPLQACCTNLTLACPSGTGDVYRVGYATNDVANPWTLCLGEGTYIYNIHQKTVARPGEQLAEGYWRTTVKVDMTAEPHVTISNDEYLDAIDDLSEGAFKAFKVSGQASFSSEERYIILGSDTQTVGSGEGFNRALVKSRFTFDFTRSFRVDGTMQVGNAADGTAVGFVPNGADLNVSSDFSNEGSALGIYRCSKNGHGLFLEFDTLGEGYRWGGHTDNLGNSNAHFVLTTTDASGNPSNVKGQHVIFNGNYSLPTGVMNYAIDYDSFSKEMLFTIKSGAKTWKLCYTNPPAVFGTTKAYMTLSGAMRYSPADTYGVGAYGSAAPKTKITIVTFNYVNDSMTGAVENTFRNRQEALVTYNAWGGAFADGEETSGIYANGARYDTPTDNPTRDGYTFDGWYASWTNGAAKAVHGARLDPIADTVCYAKWVSPSTKKEEGTNTLACAAITNAAGEVVSDGAVLLGAKQALESPDLAVPDFTSNGTESEAKPYEIIAERAFAFRRYDKPRAIDTGHPELRLSSVTISTYVTNIQSYAFADCQAMTNVTFAKTRDYNTGTNATLYVRDWAFYNSSVKTVTFPAGSSVVLDFMAFAHAEKLEDIYLLGDVKVASRYPFMQAGRSNVDADGEQIPVRLHLSAKLAADPDYVAALTNGMTAARLCLDQQVEGKVALANFSLAGNDVTVDFAVDADSPWAQVTQETVYLFWSTSPDPDTFIGNTPQKPETLTENDNGTWTATFKKPSAAGGEATFFQLCVGDAR